MPDIHWVTHSVQPVHITITEFRVTIGNKDCQENPRCVIYKHLGMSFGPLSRPMRSVR